MEDQKVSHFIHHFAAGRIPATVLVLHGAGGDENDLVPVARALAPGAAFLSPRGKVLEAGLHRFFARVSDDVFEDTEVRARAAQLAEWVGAAVAHYHLDASRVYALGFSNGANIAAAMMLLYPELLAGALLLRPRPILQLQDSPNLNGRPILVIAGALDENMPRGSSEQLARSLGKANGAVEMAMLETGHELTPQDFLLGKSWFEKTLGLNSDGKR